ncbi:MAG: hypothetical protein A2158_03795 [Chloroflexi bacterium RBG_13_46_14]|nr:MAG: hypothetical protein A2158_03795 [Chloroflexi bacterium RBG_13_46_14]
MKRIKKWITILPILVVTAILGLSPVTALAADEDVAAENPDYPYTGSLAIVAPRIARENQEISMRVFLRWNQEPFEGAGVWAFTRDQAEIMRNEVRKLAEDPSTPIDKKDYEALASIHGTPIGTTGSDGRVYHSFENKGTYLLAAVKRGYFPGFTTIRIGTMPKAMVLDAPQKARVDETVTMTVTQRGTGTAIENAGIWAFTKERAEEFHTDINAIRESSDIAAEDIDYESLANIYGEFLGRTDSHGQLNHAFSKEGAYLLISIKRGYIPGRAGIRIGEPTFKSLAIEAPKRARVGDEVTMTVYDSRTTEPIEGAGVWALARDKMGSLQADMKALREDTAVAAEDKNYESLMNIYGEFLGRTNGSGQVNHVFEEKGGYLLVTVKPGYFPGWTTIHVINTPDLDNSDDVVRPYRDSINATSLRPDLQNTSVSIEDTTQQ